MFCFCCFYNNIIIKIYIICYGVYISDTDIIFIKFILTSLAAVRGAAEKVGYFLFGHPRNFIFLFNIVNHQITAFGIVLPFLRSEAAVV